MTTTKPTTMSMFTYKIAAGVIIAAIIGLTSLGFSTIDNKVDTEKFDEYCKQTEKRLDAMQSQMNSQIKINTALLETLNRLEVKVTKVETNTEWLIKDRKE